MNLDGSVLTVTEMRYRGIDDFEPRFALLAPNNLNAGTSDVMTSRRLR